MMRWKQMVLMVVGFLMLTSCHYKDLYLEDIEEERAEIRVPVDWSRFFETKPTGMTVMAFPDDEQGKPTVALSNDLAYADLPLSAGYYHVLVFNQSIDEFGSFHFEGMDKYSTACVKANPLSTKWDRSRTDEPIIRNPEWLAAGRLNHVVVTDEMVSSVDSIFVTDTVKPRDAIYTIHVRIHVKGIYNILSAQASLDGMADGFVFSTHKPTATRRTQLLEHWTFTKNKDNPANGLLSAKIKSFGLPDGHQNLPAENVLQLTLLLVDNKTKLNYTFEVGDKFQRGKEDESSGILLPTADEENLDLSLSIDSKIPDVKPEGSSSGGGFDAKVDDWGDDIDINVGM